MRIRFTFTFLLLHILLGAGFFLSYMEGFLSPDSVNLGYLVSRRGADSTSGPDSQAPADSETKSADQPRPAPLPLRSALEAICDRESRRLDLQTDIPSDQMARQPLRDLAGDLSTQLTELLDKTGKGFCLTDKTLNIVSLDLTEKVISRAGRNMAVSEAMLTATLPLSKWCFTQYSDSHATCGAHVCIEPVRAGGKGKADTQEVYLVRLKLLVNSKLMAMPIIYLAGSGESEFVNPGFYPLGVRMRMLGRKDSGVTLNITFNRTRPARPGRIARSPVIRPGWDPYALTVAGRPGTT
jgi:hypothetical protein